ncbi:MAG TPA: DUF4915 domain-containing protein [Candidatus Eisenbacteria bacterium]|nr:DUF4915 domain-containing protein [Candidatus Eisenbacteria bacterium]
MSIRERLHAHADGAWRDPRAVAASWVGADGIDERLLRHRTRGRFWETLAATGTTLLVTREYEHLLVALHAGRRGPVVSYLPLPHPSGIAVDRRRGVVHVASTRNPNQVHDLVPAVAAPPVVGARAERLAGRPLVPVRTRVLPGGTYLHDLALVGGRLHGNAVGRNAVVRIDDDGTATPVWWPRCVERRGRPRLDRNYLQLNSIAAGRTVRGSYFSASTDAIGRLRPGHLDFPVDRRGVVFSGATREPVVRGLTRPHSARLRRGALWVDDSGYGEVGTCRDGRFEAIARPGGWTRGLGFSGGVAWVGTSRVLTRFRQYAPGLDPDRCICGVHAIDARSGRVLGSLVWPLGNQVFAVEPVPATWTSGLPIVAGRREPAREQGLFYGFVTE